MSSQSRALRKTHALLAALGLSLVVVMVLELTARVALWLADDVLEIGTTEAAADGPATRGLDYDLGALLREQENLPRPSYQPYTVWRNRPWEGTYFHVDADGFRITRYNSQRSDALRIWMLGGSTMFGYGAPDDQTIPSHLARLLGEEGWPVRVDNLGQGGYVSTQEAGHLLRELQVREPPHVVIFYDGYNDAVAAKNWPTVPGSHFQLDRIRSRFEGAFAPLIHSSGLFRGMELVLRRVLPATASPSPEQVHLLGQQAAEIWLTNAALIQGFGKARHFHSLFFLQPAEKHTVLDAMGDAVFRKVSLEAGGLAGIYDLRDVFRGEEDRFFLDGVHLTGPGNERIARRIAERLKPEICPELHPREGADLPPPCESR